MDRIEVFVNTANDGSDRGQWVPVGTIQGDSGQVNWQAGLPFLIIIAIAVITVSFQTIKAAVANPVKSLRTE